MRGESKEDEQRKEKDAKRGRRWCLGNLLRFKVG